MRSNWDVDVEDGIVSPTTGADGGETHVYVLAADGSAESEAAARWLGDLCRHDAAAQVIAVHVFDPAVYLADYRAEERAGGAVSLPPLDVAMEREANEAFAVVLPALGLDPGQVRTLVVAGRPDVQFRAVADRQEARAIVLGRRPASGWRQRFMRPGLAERLLKTAACPVIAIAAPEAA